MATTHIVWYGVVVEFSASELTHITNTMNTGAAGAGALTVALAAIGITGPAAVITSIAGAALGLGAAALNGCNSKGIGIFLHVLWVGVPWCRSR